MKIQKRIFTLILQSQGIISLQQGLDEELKSLQEDGNQIINVDVKPDSHPNFYLATITYSYQEEDQKSLRDLISDTRIWNHLRAQDISTVEQLHNIDLQKMSKIRGMGRQSISLLRQILDNHHIPYKI